MTNSDVGTLLREIRTRAGLTQTELAKRIGSAVSTLSQWEDGRNRIPFPRAIDICESCGYKVIIRRKDADTDGWVPRYILDPPEDGTYLVTNKGTATRVIGIDVWRDGRWLSGETVIAWRDLPSAWEDKRKKT